MLYPSKPAFDIPVIVPVVSPSSSILFRYYIPVFPWISLLMRVLFSQIDATYFNHVIYTNWQIPNFYLACFFVSPFAILFVLFHFLHISVSSLIGQPSRHIIFQSLLFSYPFHLSPFLFLFPGSLFSYSVNAFFSLFPFLHEARHTGVIFEMGLRTCQSVIRPSPFFLFPLATNFLCCEPSLTCH